MSTRRVRLIRRARTVPTHVLLFAVATVGAPVFFGAAFVVDLVRRVVRGRPFITVRLFAFGWVYLAVGNVGLVALFVQWIGAGFGRSQSRMLEGAYRVQQWWASSLFGAVRRLLGLEVEVEGLDVVAPGPVIVLMRHASIVDTLLPNVLITTGAGIRLRYVLKRELLADPTLDIGGNRLINHFVDRDGDSRVEMRAVVRLADGLTDSEGVLIYPEGTRFTKTRRALIIDQAEAAGDPLAQRAERLRRVLPPRPGGASVLLGTGHDVVVVAHTGLEPLATIPDAWSGRIIGSRLRVRVWRHAAATVPTDRRGRVDWLFDRWEEIDRWLGE